MRASLRRAFALLQKKLADLPEHFATKREEVLARGEGNSRAGTAHSRSTLRRGQDSHPWRLSSRPGALHRKRFCHSRFRRRTGAAVERTKTETLRVARRRRHDALISIRGLQRALAASDAPGGHSVSRTLGRSLVSADQQHLFAELSRDDGRRGFHSAR